MIRRLLGKMLCVCVCVCGLHLSQIEEGHRVAWVAVVSPAFLARVVELHVPDLSFAFRTKLQIMMRESLRVILTTDIHSSTNINSCKLPSFMLYMQCFALKAFYNNHNHSFNGCDCFCWVCNTVSYVVSVLLMCFCPVFLLIIWLKVCLYWNISAPSLCQCHYYTPSLTAVSTVSTPSPPQHPPLQGDVLFFYLYSRFPPRSRCRRAALLRTSLAS